MRRPLLPRLRRIRKADPIGPSPDAIAQLTERLAALELKLAETHRLALHDATALEFLLIDFNEARRDIDAITGDDA